MNLFEDILCKRDGEKDKIKNLVESQQYVIISAPTGYYKSELAKRVAEEITGNLGEVQEFVFHSQMSYVDFVKGLALQTDQGKCQFEEIKKPFLTFLEKASKNYHEDPQKKFVAIFDDISRGELSEILGDAMTAMEPDGRKHHWTGDIYFTPNLYIIATCNKNLNDFEMDVAWMRRFSVYRLVEDIDLEEPRKEIAKPDCDHWSYFECFQQEMRLRIKILYDWYYIGDENKKEDYRPGYKFFDICRNINDSKNTKDGLDCLEELGNKIAYVLVPLLRKYIRDGIIDHKSSLDLDAIEKWAKNDYSDDFKLEWINSDNHNNHNNDVRYCIKCSVGKGLPKALWYLALCNNLNVLFEGQEGYFRKIGYIVCQKEYYKLYKAHPNMSNGYYVSFQDDKPWYIINGIEIGKPVYSTTSVKKPKTPRIINHSQISSEYLLDSTEEELNKYITILNERKKGKHMSNGSIREVMKTTGIKQIILQGPPGTSKTYTANLLIEQLAKKQLELGESESIDLEKLRLKYGDGGRPTNPKYEKENDIKFGWDMVQFHPSYGFEDFVRGIKVSTNNNGISYDTVNKTFGNICDVAHHNPDGTFVLLIDEINRANVANVFGELIYALEYRDKGVSIAYSCEDSFGEDKKRDSSHLIVPDNLYIIGTMNTADKSVGAIDYAIRRRFLFFDLLPDRKIVEKHYGDKYGNAKKVALAIFDFIDDLFSKCLSDEYQKRDMQIGHTYLLTIPEEDDNITDKDLIEKLGYRFIYQILPIIYEYKCDEILQLVRTDNPSTKLEQCINKMLDYFEGKPIDVGEVFGKIVNLYSKENG